MTRYQPISIASFETGLVQNRENFLLPNDAYPILQNAYVWRERLKRKKGVKLLGRLQRDVVDGNLGNSGASPWTFNIYSTLIPPIIAEPNAQIQPGSVVITIDPVPLTGAITGYTKDINCIVRAIAHGLVTGQIITISGVIVVPETGDNSINGGPYTISVINPNFFRIGVNSLGWGTYLAGGMWTVQTGGGQLIDQGDGTLETEPVSGTSGTIDYLTGNVTITGGPVGFPTIITFGYYPSLPVMGIRIREDQNSNFFQTIIFDQKYAYNFVGGSFQEFIPGTTWNANNSDVSGTDFFWSTNYWIADGNRKVFWVTNYSGPLGDPIRYTDGRVWIDFEPQIDNVGTRLQQCLCMLPFRGRMVVFNTYEGATLAGSNVFTNRIRWAAIGTPFSDVSAIVTPVNVNAWRDDIRGQGGFLDIPTSENIVSVGFVRDNLVVYCERSTWQLRHTGRSIAPFIIEKINSENGAEGTFSTIQFDTSLVGVGDKGILECDSYKSTLIDVKLPDYVFRINANNNGAERVHGIRNFISRLAYWTIPTQESNGIFPDQRLVYNYENDSWALFNDSLTCLGTIQVPNSPTWLQINKPWIDCNFPWIANDSNDPAIIGGNQQGFVLYLDALAYNDSSLFIARVIPNLLIASQIVSPYHNMKTGFVIGISGIPEGSPYSSLNNGIYGIVLDGVDPDNAFSLTTYNPDTDEFDIPVLLANEGDYIGGGLINIRENFSIVSKKFNYMKEGQSIQLGYLDILMEASYPENEGAISLNVYLDYNDDEATNILPLNQDPLGILPPFPFIAPDAFFNSVIPTTPAEGLNTRGGSKFWQRVFCPTRGNFITLEYKFNNAQMAGRQEELEVQIDAQTLWVRAAGRLTQF